MGLFITLCGTMGRVVLARATQEGYVDAAMLFRYQHAPRRIYPMSLILMFFQILTIECLEDFFDGVKAAKQ